MSETGKKNIQERRAAKFRELMRSLEKQRLALVEKSAQCDALVRHAEADRDRAEQALRSMSVEFSRTKERLKRAEAQLASSGEPVSSRFGGRRADIDAEIHLLELRKQDHMRRKLGGEI